MRPNKIYFRNLDSIRFIAAMLVFLAHGISTSFNYLNLNGTLLGELLGGLGVSIFFILSGFLITYLLISEYEMTGEILVRNFYVRRVLRIWPLYYAVVIFSCFIYPYIKNLSGTPFVSAANPLMHFTFLSNFDVIRINKYFNDKVILSQVISWSVSVEEQFYLFWPIIFAFLPKNKWVYMILFAIISSVIFRVINYDDNFVRDYHTMSVLMDLGIGGLLAYLIKVNKRIQYFFESISTISHLSLFVFAISIFLWGSEVFKFKYCGVFNKVLLSSFIGLIIAAQAMTKNTSFLNLGRISFANKWGRYTYGIYMLHPISLHLMDFLSHAAHISINSFISSFSSGVLAFLITLIMSWLSYHYFESRFLALKSKFEIIKTGH